MVSCGAKQNVCMLRFCKELYVGCSYAAQFGRDCMGQCRVPFVLFRHLVKGDSDLTEK